MKGVKSSNKVRILFLLREFMFSERGRTNTMRRSARAIIITNDGILMIYRNKGNGREYYAFPGGGIKRNESFQECLVRELQEETGLIINPIKEFARITSTDSEQHFWLCDIVDGTSFGHPTGIEHIKYSPDEYSPRFIPWEAFDSTDNLITEYHLTSELSKCINSDIWEPIHIITNRNLL